MKRRCFPDALCACLIACATCSLEAGTNSFFVRPLLITERGEVPSYVARIGTNEFSFLPPPGWVATFQPKEQAVLLRPRDFSAQMRIEINSALALPLKLDDAALEQEVRTRFSKGTITHQFPCYSSDLNGRAFDVQTPAEHGKTIFTRLALVPGPSGWIEFQLTCSASHMTNFLFGFDNLLTSFRVERLRP